jgi:very-short-patch-repair endonuclease
MIRRRKSPPKSGSTPLTESELEGKFLNLLLANGLKPTQQHKFHPVRNWRFDFCWPDKKLAIEVQGFGPGHNSLLGMLSDYEKHNAALILGWRIIYFMSRDLDAYYQANTLCIVKRLLEESPNG